MYKTISEPLSNFCLFVCLYVCLDMYKTISDQNLMLNRS